MGRHALPKGHALNHRLNLCLNDADYAALKRRRTALIKAGLLEPKAKLTDAVRLALQRAFGEPIAATEKRAEVEAPPSLSPGSTMGTLCVRMGEAADLPAGAAAVHLFGSHAAEDGEVYVLHVHCLPEVEPPPDPRLGEFLRLREEEEILVPRGAVSMQLHSVTMEKVDFSSKGFTRRDPVACVLFVGAKKS